MSLPKICILTMILLRSFTNAFTLPFIVPAFPNEFSAALPHRGTASPVSLHHTLTKSLGVKVFSLSIQNMQYQLISLNSFSFRINYTQHILFEVFRVVTGLGLWCGKYKQKGKQVVLGSESMLMFFSLCFILFFFNCSIFPLIFSFVVQLKLLL